VIVMEHAAGGQLDTWISANGRFTEGRARSVFLQLAGAVAYCHRQVQYLRSFLPMPICGGLSKSPSIETPSMLARISRTHLLAK